MAYRVSPHSLEAAAAHLCRYGDTDLFPHLRELAFFAEDRQAVVSELATLDLDTYLPLGAIEALAPKGRYAFRIAHQLPALDNILLLACVIELGEKIEAKRQSPLDASAFSYRFAVDAKSGQIFRADRTYKDWLSAQRHIIDTNKVIKKIVSTDISDFYARINFHRLENLLDEVAPKHGACRFIKKHIKAIRAKQSFGLPVGGSAARLLAELALSDTDQALVDRGLLVTRFVDDFRILLTSKDDPYDALGFLAEQLGINEGLSLNAAKTSVASRRDYSQRLERLMSDVAEEAEGVALDILTTNVYFDDEPDEDDIEKLKGVNLVELLEKEIGADEWDIGRIKVIFRALKIVKPKEAIDFILSSFSELIVFAKELCLLMEALQAGSSGCFDELLDELVDAIATPPASSVQLIRTWLLEIFVRGIVQIPLLKLKELEHLQAVIDKRQLLLIRGRGDDKNYFRRHKTAVQNFSDIELPYLVWGAACLPTDEYEKWIDTVRPSFGKPLGAQYLRWVAKNRPRLTSKLIGATIDHPD